MPHLGHLLLFLLLATSHLQTAAYTAKLGLLFRIHDLDGKLLGPEWRKISTSALMAISHVNSRNTVLVPEADSILLPDLQLEYEVWDTRSSPTKGVEGAVVWSTMDVDIIIGSFRSAVSGPVSLVAEITKTPMVSYGSTAASLSNKITYPSFSRVCPADSLLALAIIRICQEFEWSRIAVIYQDDSYGAGYAQDIDYYAGIHNVQVASSQKYQSGVEDTIKSALEVTRESGARVIICITGDVDLPQVAKWGQHFGLIGKGYVYLTGDAISLDQNHNSVEVKDFVKGWLRLAAGPLYGERGRKFQEVFATEEKSAYLHPLLRTTLEDLEGECDDYCAFFYDAVWTAAVAISKTAQETGSVADKDMLLHNLRNSAFEGATGKIKLDPITGDRSADGILVLIKNWNGDPDNEANLMIRDTWIWDQQGGLQRVAETPPTWPGSWVTWTPPMDGTSCAAGAIYNGDTLTCVACPPGHQPDPSESQCLPCEPGFIAPHAGMPRCEACQEGYANHTGMTMCESCPRFSARTPNSPGTSKSECKCEVNYYRPPGQTASGECLECPVGAVCAGADTLPYPRAGFWAERGCKEFGGELECTKWDTFLECNPSANCAGGQSEACREGRTGRMCMAAAPGWFIVGEEFWFRCGDSGHVITLAGIAAVVLCWIAIEIMAGHNHTSTSTALLFVQVSTMIGTFGLRWHPYLQVVNTVFAIADFDVDFVQPNCLGPWTDVYSFYLQLLLPFIFTGFHVLFYAARKAIAGWRWADIKARAPETGMKKYILFNITIYHTLCTKCFQTFRCDTFPDGEQYMTDSPEVQCWTPTHVGMLSTAIVYTLVIILGTPALLLWKIHSMQSDGTLHTADALRRWSFAHYCYEADYKWWEVMLLLRRFVVAILAVALDSVPMMQGAITIVALTGLLAAHVFAKPYISATVDVLDFVSLVGTIMFVLVGLLMYPSITTGAQGVLCADFGLEDYEGETTALSKVCQQEQALKTGVAVFAILILAITLFVAIALAYTVVREELASKRAALIIYKGLKQDTTASMRAPSAFVAIPSSKFPTDLLQTANKVALEQILNGNKLLRWASSLREKMGGEELRTMSRIRSQLARVNSQTDSQLKLGADTECYMDVDSRVQALPEDVTQYSRGARARVLRALCEIPGVIEYLAWRDDRGREGLLHFVEGMAAFTAAADEDKRPFPISDIVKFEHRPLIMQMLLINGVEGKQSFQTVMDAIFASNHVTAATEGRNLIAIDASGRASPRTRSRLISGKDSDGTDSPPPRRGTISPFGLGGRSPTEVPANSTYRSLASRPGSSWQRMRDDDTTHSEGERSAIALRASNLLKSSSSNHRFSLSGVGVNLPARKPSKRESAQWELLESRLFAAEDHDALKIKDSLKPMKPRTNSDQSTSPGTSDDNATTQPHMTPSLGSYGRASNQTPVSPKHLDAASEFQFPPYARIPEREPAPSYRSLGRDLPSPSSASRAQAPPTPPSRRSPPAARPLAPAGSMAIEMLLNPDQAAASLFLPAFGEADRPSSAWQEEEEEPDIGYA